jgi:DNA invertase Pin-like site-specific DNA recombinase
MTTYGYACVSVRDRDEGQIRALRAEGCDVTFCDQVPGGRGKRPLLVSLMKSLKSGDRVIVTKLDRFGRSTRELLELIVFIGSEGAFFKSLGDPMFDTASPTGLLLSPLLAAIAEFERSLLSERTAAGRARAKDRGVRFGRPPKLTKHQRREALERLRNGDRLEDVARSYNVDPTTIGRLRDSGEDLG